MTAPETRAPPPSVPSQTSQGEQRIQDGGVCRGIYAESLTAGRVDKRATCVRAQRFVNSQHVCACQCSKRRGANHITRDHWWDDLRRVCTCACLFVRVCSLPLCVCVWGGREREEREYPICVLEHVLVSKASKGGRQSCHNCTFGIEPEVGGRVPGIRRQTALACVWAVTSNVPAVMTSQYDMVQAVVPTTVWYS